MPIHPAREVLVMTRSLTVLVLLSVPVAQASVVHFDDLVLNVSGVLNVPAHYNGFIWGTSVGNPKFFAIADSSYMGAGNYANGYGSPSGANAVANYAGEVVVQLSTGGPFDFNGARFSTWTSSDLMQFDSATQLTIEGYNGATLVDTALINFSAGGYSWLQADLLGVTSLRFVGFSPVPGIGTEYTRWLMDDFTFNETPAGVPVPAAIWLIAPGILAMFGALRRRSGT
jgi:hypothetical protein